MVSPGVEKHSDGYAKYEYDLPNPKRLLLFDVPQRLWNVRSGFGTGITPAARKGGMKYRLSARS